MCFFDYNERNHNNEDFEQLSKNNNKVSFNEISSTMADENQKKDFIFVLKQLAKKRSKQLAKILIVPTAYCLKGEPKFLIFNEKVYGLIFNVNNYVYLGPNTHISQKTRQFINKQSSSSVQKPETLFQRL